MGSCAFLMPIGSLRFIRLRRYSLRPALGLARTTRRANRPGDRVAGATARY
jgi:hypothetical protein